MIENLSQLAREIRSGGKCTQQQISEVRDRLRNPAIGDDFHNLLRVLALASPPTPENVVLAENFLADEIDDYDRQGAVYALCNYWGLAADYKERLVELGAPERWDDGSASSIAALNALGKLLHRDTDAGLLALLAQWLRHELAGSDLKRRAVYAESLHRAIDIAINGPAVEERYIGFRIEHADAALIDRASQLPVGKRSKKAKNEQRGRR